MPRPRICFTVVSEALGGQQFAFDGEQPILIGRTPDNTLALDHKSVSRRHARVEPEGSGYVLVDQGSHNGTRVGDRLVSKHVLASGDVIGLGELRLRVTFEGGDSGAAPPPPVSTLPAVASAQGPQAGALARPLTVEELFARAGPTQALPVSKPRRNYWPAIYTLLMVTVVVVGLATFWAVGVRPQGTPRLDVLVRAGEALPVDMSRLPAPDRQGWTRGILRVEEIRRPTDERVADAKKTRFPEFVSVRGKTLGTTDIAVYGPPVGWVILRVLVRDTKPDPEPLAWLNKPVNERRDYALEILRRAKTIVINIGSVNERTWQVAKDLDLAARLLEAIPGETANATWASQTARELRQALDRRYEVLAREINVLREQGKLREALAKALELKSLFPDPETEEHHVVNSFYDILADEEARAAREAQEKR